jgi:hypothetical protein
VAEQIPEAERQNVQGSASTPEPECVVKTPLLRGLGGAPPYVLAAARQKALPGRRAFPHRPAPRDIWGHRTRPSHAGGRAFHGFDHLMLEGEVMSPKPARGRPSLPGPLFPLFVTREQSHQRWPLRLKKGLKNAGGNEERARGPGSGGVVLDSVAGRQVDTRGYGRGCEWIF